MNTIRRQEPSVPNLGGQLPKRPPDEKSGHPGQDAPRPPPRPPPPPGHNPGGTARSATPPPRPRLLHPSAEDAAMAPLPIEQLSPPSTPRSRSRHGDGQSERSRSAGVSPSRSEHSRPPSPSADSTRSRSPRPPHVRPATPPRGDKRDRPASSTSRGGARRRRRNEDIAAGVSPSLDEAETTEEMSGQHKPE